MKNYLDIAKEYHAAGLHVIPVNKDKTPLCNWSAYIESQTEQDIEGLFKNDCYGIAMLTGVNGVEVLDIDCKYDVKGTMFSEFKELINNSGAVSVYETVFQVTPTKGFHCIYRCSEIEGNKKLASRPATNKELEKYNTEVRQYNSENEHQRKEITDPNRLPKVLFETRGTRGYVLIDPTPKYSLQALPLTQAIPEITPYQRQVIHSAAKAFHSIIDRTEKRETEKKYEQAIEVSTDLPCWNDYDNRGDVLGLLEKHGWKVVRRIGKRTLLKRPGDTKAKYSGNYHHELRMFKSFSTSTCFDAEKAYGPFAVYTKLEHNGDFSQAAKELYRRGYGGRINSNSLPNNIPSAVSSSTTTEAEEQQTPISDLIKSVEETKFSITKKVQHKKATLHYFTGGKKYRVAGDEMICGLTGDKGSGKTLLLSILLASALSGGNQVLNFSLDIGDRKILDFDTEQPSEFFQTSRRRAFPYGKP